MKKILVSVFIFMFASCSRNREVSNDLKKELEVIRTKYSLPSLAAVIVNAQGTTEIAATGKRAFDHEESVTIHDRYHLGSNTKSITATLLARLIEKGHFQWGDTLSDVFEDYDIHRGIRSVSLESLLRHTGGVTDAIPKSYPVLWKKFYEMQGKEEPMAQRSLIAEAVLKDKPMFKTGVKSNYSNAGITLVGHALEKKLGISYENLLNREIFTPLDMRSCGLGAPGVKSKIDEPRGHIIYQNKLYSVPPGSRADNPDAIAPASKVHCSVVDWGKYIRNHLVGSKVDSSFLKKSSYNKLHSSLSNGIYALGWLRQETPWDSKKKGMFHSGSNTMNYAEMWFSSDDNIGIGVVTNTGTAEAMKAVREVVKSVIEKRL